MSVVQYWCWRASVNGAASLPSRSSGGGSRKDEASGWCSPIGLRALSFLQCVDSWHCWLGGRKDIQPLKTVPFSKALRYGNIQFYLQTYHICLYSPAAQHHRLLAGTHFTVPQRVEGWVDSTWLAGYKPKWFTCSQTVTHPSDNRARRSVTLLIETSVLPLSQATMENCC